MIQGHTEEQCYVVHPKLYAKEKIGQNARKRQEEIKKKNEDMRSEVADMNIGLQIDKNEGKFVEKRHKLKSGEEEEVKNKKRYGAG